MDRTRLLLAVTASSLTLVACAHDPSREQVGTVGGAVIGGAAGHALTGGSAIGTVGGAAAGALIGQDIGQDMDRHHRH